MDDERADEVVHILDNAESIDLDGRRQDWAASGWNDPLAASGAMPVAGGIGGASAMERDIDRSMIDRDAVERDGSEAIPIVQEELVVGKRAVETGGVRVRSYIVETPVSEQIGLRDEHVTVERRRVDLPLSAARAMPSGNARSR